MLSPDDMELALSLPVELLECSQVDAISWDQIRSYLVEKQWKNFEEHSFISPNRFYINEKTHDKANAINVISLDEQRSSILVFLTISHWLYEIEIQGVNFKRKDRLRITDSDKGELETILIIHISDKFVFGVNSSNQDVMYQIAALNNSGGLTISKVNENE